MNITDEKKETVNGWDIERNTCRTKYGVFVRYRISMTHPKHGYMWLFANDYESAVKFAQSL